MVIDGDRFSASLTGDFSSSHWGEPRGIVLTPSLGHLPTSLDPVTDDNCLICGESCIQDPAEGLRHKTEPADRHRPKVRNPFTAGQDSNQGAARIIREATGD